MSREKREKKMKIKVIMLTQVTQDKVIKPTEKVLDSIPKKKAKVSQNKLSSGRWDG